MTFNHLNRRLHLYLSLSLLPWFLVHALSSLAIQHRSLFTDNPKAKWTPRFEREYTRQIPQENLRQTAADMLAELDLKGSSAHAELDLNVSSLRASTSSARHG